MSGSFVNAEGERTNQIADQRVDTGDSVLNIGAIRADGFPFNSTNNNMLIYVAGVLGVIYMLTRRK